MICDNGVASKRSSQDNRQPTAPQSGAHQDLPLPNFAGLLCSAKFASEEADVDVDVEHKGSWIGPTPSSSTKLGIEQSGKTPVIELAFDWLEPRRHQRTVMDREFVGAFVPAKRFSALYFTSTTAAAIIV
ncbi:hypothetical protein KQX54_017716 [Cotesia glomerata]|uniref:Uncharacterized protein n=1 Tax=Cotesia glomerata TaxID=32391 RepID=A0AAV7IXM2_COTGL|nr:hypothetical protein KQX54_017716 [Cotesia glomerata]